MALTILFFFLLNRLGKTLDVFDGEGILLARFSLISWLARLFHSPLQRHSKSLPVFSTVIQIRKKAVNPASMPCRQPHLSLNQLGLPFHVDLLPRRRSLLSHDEPFHGDVYRFLALSVHAHPVDHVQYRRAVGRHEQLPGALLEDLLELLKGLVWKEVFHLLRPLLDHVLEPHLRGLCRLGLGVCQLGLLQVFLILLLEYHDVLRALSELQTFPTTMLTWAGETA